MDTQLMSKMSLAFSALSFATNIVVLYFVIRVWQIVHHPSLLFIGIANVAGILLLVLWPVLNLLSALSSFSHDFTMWRWMIRAGLNSVVGVINVIGLVKLLLWIPELLDLKALDMSGRPEND